MAIVTLTDLANYALNKINAGSIVSIDGTDRTATICKRYIDLAMIQAISDGEFTSAKRRIALTANTALTRPDYTYCYFLPTDYVKIDSLESGMPLEIENLCLFTDDDAPIAVYFAMTPVLSAYQPFVVDVMGLTLSTMICMELKGDSKVLGNAMQELRVAVRRAKSHDRSEKNGKKPNAAKWDSFNTGIV